MRVHDDQVDLLHERLLQDLLFDLLGELQVAEGLHAGLGRHVDHPLEDALHLVVQRFLEIPAATLHLAVTPDQGHGRGRIDHREQQQLGVKLRCERDCVADVGLALVVESDRHEDAFHDPIDHVRNDTPRRLHFEPIGAILCRPSRLTNPPLDLKSLKIERRPQASRRRTNPWPLRAIALILVAGAIWVFWTPVRSFIDRINLPEVRTLLVTEATPASVAAVQGTAANGYVVAARRAALSSDVPGRIVELNVREGSIVKKDDIVARLYSDEYRAALERAAADLAVAEASVGRATALVAERAADEAQAGNAEKAVKARVEEADAEVAFAVSEHTRATKLLASGIGSDRDVERTRNALDTRKARHATALADLATAALTTAATTKRLEVAKQDVVVAAAQRDAAAATHKQAQATLDKTDVRAPFDGIVILKDAEIGEVVSPNVQGGSSARGAVCTMVDFDSLEIQAEVPETSLSSVELGAPADVFLDAYPDDKLTGLVDRIWPTADRSKATVEVRIIVDEGQRERLRPEYGVRVIFRDAETGGPVEASLSTEKQIVIPENAIVEIDGSPTAFVLERDTVRATPLTIGERKNGRATIEAGLRPGQRIVAEPPPSLQDKDRVRIAET